MEEFFRSIIEKITGQHDVFLYIFLFLSSIIENLFPPIPGDTITAFGAFLVGTGRLNYWLVYLVTTTGSVIGFMTFFTFGRLLGKEFFEKRNFSFLSNKTLVSAENWFIKYGYIAVLVNRFVPGIRSAFSLVAGILKLKPLYVAIAALGSAAAWNLMYIQIGYSLGNNWHVIKEKLIQVRNLNIIAASIVGGVIILIIIFRIIKKRRAAKHASVETKDSL